MAWFSGARATQRSHIPYDAPSAAPSHTPRASARTSTDGLDGPSKTKRSGWFNWAPMNRAFDAVMTVGRRAIAVAAVTLGLTMGFGSMTQGAPVDVTPPPAAAATVQQADLQTAAPSAERPIYVVKSGDSLDKIARRFGTTTSSILAINDIPIPKLIFPGDRIELPDDVDPDRVTSAGLTPRSFVRPVEATPRVDAPAFYVVHAQDRLGDIARHFGISTERLIELNGLDEAGTIRENQRLRLRDGGESRGTSGPVETAPIAVPVAPAQNDLGVAHLSAEARAVFTDQTPSLTWGMSGPSVRVLQERLLALGYPLGDADASFGGRTRSAVRAFQAFNGIDADGVVGLDTKRALASSAAIALPTDNVYPSQRVYRPYTADAYRLFLAAADQAGVPREWAIADSLHKLIDAESDGEVGRPNYTYGNRADRPSAWPEIHAELQRGRISARSSATGIGQLLLDNVAVHYPSGAAGINVPIEEAVGMLSYIEDRHTTPDNAWRRYNSVHEGY